MIRVSEGIEIIDRPKLYAWLNDAYWARTRSQELIDKSLAQSLCFSAWIEDEMVGFARVVTDYSTFAWLCDVFVDHAHRGKGVGKALVRKAMEHPELQSARWMLGTRDAHSLYEQFGFKNVPEPDRFMVKGFAPRPPKGQT